MGERIEPALRGLGCARDAPVGGRNEPIRPNACITATAVVDLEAALGMDRDARAPVLVEMHRG